MQRQQYIGNVTHDIELRTVKVGGEDRSVAEISIAVNDDYNKEKAPLFLAFDVWDTLAENCCKYLKKGSAVYVETTMRNNNYERPDGSKVYGYRFTADYVKFLPSRNDKETE